MKQFKDQLKVLLIENQMTMTQLVQRLNERFNRNDSLQNLNNKLSKSTIRYNEVEEIAEVLNYEILWMPINSDYVPPDDKDYQPSRMTEVSSKVTDEAEIVKIMQVMDGLRADFENLQKYVSESTHAAKELTKYFQNDEKKLRKLIETSDDES